jgi:hypothetical protein
MTTTAQILDFAEYRQRKAARDAKRAGAPARRFVWSWPAAGQLSVVNFPAPGPAPSSMLSQIS